MKGSIFDVAEIGIVHCMAYPNCNESEEEFISSIKELLVDPFFSIIEIGQLPFTSLNDSIPKLIHSAQCQLTYSAHSRLFKNKLNINSIDERERKEAVAELKKGIDEAYSFNSLNYQFLSRQWSIETQEENLQSLVKSTIELCNYANSKGSMPVCLEIFDYDIDKCSLIGKSSLAARYCSLVREQCNNFGLMVDLSHIPLIKESIEDHINPIKDYVTHVHIGNALMSDVNNIAYGDKHPSFGYPGSENDIPELVTFLRKLIDIGYINPNRKSNISFEIKPQGNEDSRIVIANAKRSLIKAWSLV
jgi:sugar phosphate isomerase/epimerase